ncbi:hypothetical protein Ddye_015444 [Dipteronia dyeriana]|uniref:Uncharacterized protein n=1 Tax=Dipteronia dyeriana TaxID=168575 RepID=A0AAD9WZJ1_9ROSI|nr:hypothetical protein Ddye_015444 [Dipteronia dyeriana]
MGGADEASVGDDVAALAVLKLYGHRTEPAREVVKLLKSEELSGLVDAVVIAGKVAVHDDQLPGAAVEGYLDAVPRVVNERPELQLLVAVAVVIVRHHWKRRSRRFNGGLQLLRSPPLDTWPFPQSTTLISDSLPQLLCGSSPSIISTARGHLRHSSVISAAQLHDSNVQHPIV